MNVLKELLKTLKDNSIDNKVTIENVDLFVKSWTKEAEILQLRIADVSGSLPCHHNYIQKDTYWKSCTHCGMIAPLGQ